ncbi:hypothetical protein [Arthrobacter sp. ISL-69]|uniref:hypothetical protein n=1 Tax=Arthrobacter sp. ISL-69 TaxID=2819113 RepID=UPI001BE7A26C|nr:hypothetical protein [Arthrobacter sp. ISL-69]MBT2538260.1 hypothetical protein [Arthrobacter sp. ISL-69]
MNNDQQPGTPQQPDHNGWQHPDAPAPGPDSQQQQQFPPYPPQPGQPYPPQPGQQNQQGQPEFGQPPYPPRADQYNVGQPPYGEPGHGQYGQPGPGQFGQTPPKGGIPVWGWVAGGVGVVAVLAVAGVMVLGGIVSANARNVTPAPTETAGSTESAGATEEATADGSSAAATDDAVYLFEDADFTSAPVWATALPAGWTMSDAKGGTFTYSNSDYPCIFTVHQAILPPRSAITDEEATKASMQIEIDGIKKAASSPVTVVTDADSLYTKLRNADGQTIELQEAELRFKNKSNVDLVYRLAVRSMPAGDGLMELILTCPANLPTESELWTELTDTVTMKDDPAA